ncbi:unnamed protein product [Prunus armeniaca]
MCLICICRARGLLGAHRLRSHRNSEVKRVGARAIPGWVTYWEVAREFPKKKKKIVRAERGTQSRQYYVMAELIPGCDNLVSEPLCRVV